MDQRELLDFGRFDLKIDPMVYPCTQIEKHFKSLIQTGVLTTGQKLPSLRQLAKDWNVDYKTVQKAFKHLKDEGLVGGKGCMGTFIRPAQVSTMVGALFNPALTDENAFFQRAVYQFINEDILSSKNGAWNCRAYDGFVRCNSAEEIKQHPSYRQLAEDLKNHPFKGFIQLLGKLAGDEFPKLSENLPVARFGPPKSSNTDVTFDYEGFGSVSTRHLAGKGVRRIFYIRAMTDMVSNGLDLQGIQNTLSEMGLPQAEVFQFEYPSTPYDLKIEALKNTLQLIDQWESKKQWPEALLVSDDIAMRGVAPALISRGVHIRHPIPIATMTNKGIFHEYGIPIIRYEFSPKAIAQNLLDVLDKRICGKTPPELPIKVTGRLIEHSEIELLN
ncbi:MAG: GntR family transcriptional regulator [Verrucomicrobiae bacterium]|nr:GntR family transcriptional regulator [Verrucomicrobiae bacterium]